jgi:hypothetical protein
MGQAFSFTDTNLRGDFGRDHHVVAFRSCLHTLGIDHERLTFRTQGRDFRLTDVHGWVVREVLA